MLCYRYMKTWRYGFGLFELLEIGLCRKVEEHEGDVTIPCTGNLLSVVGGEQDIEKSPSACLHSQLEGVIRIVGIIANDETMVARLKFLCPIS